MEASKELFVLVTVLCVSFHWASGLSCDQYKRNTRVTCTLSGWICGEREQEWETRTLTLKYSDGRTSTKWESRYPCRGGSGGSSGGSDGRVSTCTDKVATSTCVYWRNKYGCSHSYVKPRCCKTCKGDLKPKPTPKPEPETGGGGGGGGAGSNDQGACLNSANKYRRLHVDTPSLSSDSRLSSLAQSYAERLLNKMMGEIRAGRRPRLQHDPNNKKQRTGENLYYVNTYEKGGMETFCENADKSWYDEINDYSYRYQRSKNGKAIGHFTQMVWKGSRKVGYGYAARQHPNYRSNRVIVVVAKYSPPGNYRGRYGQNVMPRK